MNIQGINGLTWLLPTATIASVIYFAGALTLGLTTDIAIWALLLPALPGVLVTWLALIVAFVDVTQRPKTQLSEEARLVWLLVLALLNVFALLPYWLVVIRRHRDTAAG
ncbi:MAG: PLDc N-terminal domain-containing protein [Sphaerobacter sp.]|nr:PLDc N-terminal domain-containing protein [Sphaerobacter sp.]